MLLKNWQFKQKLLSKAIGLLELMLALAIISIIMIMATRYYSSASASQKIQAAVDQINVVKSAVQNVSVGQVSGTIPTMGQLVQLGLIPHNFVNSADATSAINPWGGSLTIIGANTGGIVASTAALDNKKYFGILVETPNNETCLAVAEKLNATAATDNAASCPGDDSTLIVNYPM